MSSSTQTAPLSNLQLELLKMFGRSVSDTDLLSIKQLLSHFFAQKAIEQADAVWEESGFSEQTMTDWQQTHLRTPYQAYRNHLASQSDESSHWY